MTREELGGNIVLSNFDLDIPEKTIVRKLVGKYAEKIRNSTEFQELKLELKKHQKQDKESFEINVHLTADGRDFSSESQGLNVFVCIDESLKKIIQEVKNKELIK